MDKVAQGKSHKQENQWWYVEGLIAGLDATPTQKYLLTLIHLHTNARKNYAWMSQESLAREMCTDLSTVERAFRWAKKIGVVGVRRIRTGKLPSDQCNTYWLEIEQLKQRQRPPKHPAPVTGDIGEHPALMPGDESEHPASSTGNTRHFESEHPAFDTRTPGTHAGEGLEVKQYASKAAVRSTAVERAGAAAEEGRALTSEDRQKQEQTAAATDEQFQDRPTLRITPREIYILWDTALRNDWKKAWVTKIIREHYNVEQLRDLSPAQFQTLLEILRCKPKPN